MCLLRRAVIPLILTANAWAVPSGVCFVPTKLTEPSEPLPSSPLFGPATPGYDEFHSQFILPMLKAIPQKLDIFPRASEFYGNAKGEERKRKVEQFRKMRRSIEVYYIDHYNDPRDSDSTAGIWSVFFGQLVFKITEPIAGVRQQLIFNGLLPAVGVTYTDISAWSANTKRAQKPSSSRRLVDDDDDLDEPVDDTANVAADDDDDDDDDDSKQKRFWSENQYVETIAINGDNGLAVWLVHNDPDESNAFVVAISTQRTTTFSKDWKDYNAYCGKKGSKGFVHSVENRGDCDQLQTDVDEIMEQHLASSYREYEQCKKIVLCKNGAFKFEFNKANIDRLYVSAAKVTEPCVDNNGADRCTLSKVVEVVVKRDHPGIERCPFPSIAFDFKCATPLRTKQDVMYTEYEWKPSVFFGHGSKWMYRVLPPEQREGEAPPEEGGQRRLQKMKMGGKVQDPYACKHREAKNRPRFQLQKESGRITTCCIEAAPTLGRATTLPFYMSDLFAPAQDEQAPADTGGVPASEVVGKVPKDLPTPRLRDSVVGWRKDHGYSDADANNKPLTAKEYAEIVKNEDAVTDPANPDDNKVSPRSFSPSLPLVSAYFIGTLTLIAVSISSLFLLL